MLGGIEVLVSVMILLFFSGGEVVLCGNNLM